MCHLCVYVHIRTRAGLHRFSERQLMISTNRFSLFGGNLKNLVNFRIYGFDFHRIYANLKLYTNFAMYSKTHQMFQFSTDPRKSVSWYHEQYFTRVQSITFTLHFQIKYSLIYIFHQLSTNCSTWTKNLVFPYHRLSVATSGCDKWMSTSTEIIRTSPAYIRPNVWMCCRSDYTSCLFGSYFQLISLRFFLAGAKNIATNRKKTSEPPKHRIILSWYK